jgi:MFS family permease
VEHPCQQCGTTVEDGRPFCPQCRAPQIRVQVREAEVAPELALPADELSPETPPSWNYNRPPTAGRAIDSRIAARAALKAGLLGVFVGAIPFVGIVLTGALAVFFYRRKGGSKLSISLGARIGGAAGVVVFALGALFVIGVVFLHAQQQCIDAMTATLQRFGANTADPQIQAIMRDLFTASRQAISFFVAVVFASIGGALAALFFLPRTPSR